MRQQMRFTVAVVMGLLLLSVPALAYTIVMKDGSRMLAKDYRVEGDRVLITLPNGIETWIALAEVDIEKTRELNQNNLGDALKIEGGEVKPLEVEAPPKKTTLGDLARSGEARMRGRAPAVRPDSVNNPQPRQSVTGHQDLDDLRRQAYPDLSIMSELRSYFTSEGLDAQIFRGTKSVHPLIEVEASSESAVFKSLQVAAQALPQMQDRHQNRIAAIELLLKTSRGSNAGQFVITPTLAERLNSGDIDFTTFFVQYVRF